jgi:hypothetical protein
MQDSIHNPDSEPLEQKRPLLTFILGAVVVLAICISAWFLFHGPPDAITSEATVKIKMNSAEDEYITNIKVKDIALSRAENFLHQEVTILSGTVVNSGSQTVVGLQLTVQFSDQMGQVALRESRGVLGSPAAPLGPGRERSFEISVEHVPATWNMRQPSIQVSSLTLPK